MSMQLYNQVNLACSRLITTRYSTSFSLGIRMLEKRFRDPVYAIYGFVRYADEIVDTFHAYDKEVLFKEFTKDTWVAIERGISLNPVLHAFQQVVNEFDIDHELIRAFLHSMEMDLSESFYDQSSYQTYIYGSAEVVGLMCLQVFCEGDRQMYAQLKPHARSLGAAFQKVNFLRDMKDDFDVRGRVYFPGVDFKKFDAEAKAAIEEDIRQDFAHALEGIRKLPQGSRIGVYLAYRYYTKLFRKICKINPETILNQRVRINNARKVSILVRSVARHKLNLL
jgi:15-cis-phytoene synthase